MGTGLNGGVQAIQEVVEAFVSHRTKTLVKTIGAAIVVIVSTIGPPTLAQNAAEYEAVTRCFFIYAPLHEVAIRNGNDTLANYSIQRLMYVNGYVRLVGVTLNLNGCSMRQHREAKQQVLNLRRSSNLPCGLEMQPLTTGS